ncbi:MAG: DbpA RNA binding domain-containing protein [Clostridia bacterium]|nr:DbpA RNA binding domain-containing protein [Clostridia bacterium]
MEDRELLKKRFLELAKRSYNAGIYTFTDFLGLPELSAFEEIKSQLKGIKYTKFGGHPEAERKMIRFGDPEELLYEEEFPITTVKAEPVSQKFADKLSHRDILGALMNLGIGRENFGDIAIIENVAYIFIKESISEYVISSLSRARHTELLPSRVSDLPEAALFKTEEKTVQISSERLDAVIAKVFNLSRDAAQSLFVRELVYASGRLITSVSYMPKANDIISVRGHGRFIYLSYETTSRKGKLNARVALYI